MKKLDYLEKWIRPKYYLGVDHEDSYVVIGKNRDSDLLDKVNWDSVVEELEAFENSHIKGDHFFVLRDHHFLVGWVETILLTPCEDCDESFDELCEWVDDNISQPIWECGILNEDKFYEMESEKFSDDIQEWIHEWVSDNSHRVEDEWENLDVYGRVEEEVSLWGRNLEHIKDFYLIEAVEKVFSELNIIDSLKNLKIRAEECTDSRGHVLGNWNDIHTDYWKISHMNSLFNDEEFNPEIKMNVKYSDAICITCEREVRITLKPLPNEINIGGEAVALNCW